MQRKTKFGLLGVLGIWVTAGWALPYVNVLKPSFSPEQLMVFRGFITAAIALVAMKGALKRADKYTYLATVILPLATLGLFKGISYLGAGPALIILTATPLVNVAIGTFIGRRLTWAAGVGLVLVFAGVLLARWGGTFHWIGLAWTVFATVMNGIVYECFSRAKSSALQKCFYTAVGMGTLGLLLSYNHSWQAVSDTTTLMSVGAFAVVGGFLYWIANLIAFENLPTVEASVLAQGETVFVIVGAYVLLGERLTLIQGVGVVIALTGAVYLARWLAQQNHTEETVA